jgi:predicted nucleotidyltransferase
MDLFPDFRDLLAAFDESGVRYVVVGGYAVIFHGRPRATKDLDLLVAIDPDNRERLARALSAFGAPASVVEGGRAMTADQIVYFGVSPLRVDILGSASGVEFAGVYERAVRTTLDDVEVGIIGIEDLIANKKASGRPRDLEDAAELERIRARGVAH